MNPLALIFTLVVSLWMLSTTRNKAHLPLLIGFCYMTKGQFIDLGAFTFPIYRLVLGVGLIRIMVYGEYKAINLHRIEYLLIAWSLWIMFASLFHEFAPGSGPVAAAGVVYDTILAYGLIRIFSAGEPNPLHIIRSIAIVLVPIAATMIYEHSTRTNPFSIFGGVPEYVQIRDGKLRAQGPFRHPILAGTVGAGCLPLFIAIIRMHFRLGVTGIAASIIIVMSSNSSGPFLSAAAGLGAVSLWFVREKMKLVMILFVTGFIAAWLYMGRLPFYLVTYMDVTGSSTGYHRALLIDNAFKHLDEWWLFGTDRTRHWMPNQGAISPTHTDITNYYIGFGVLGGILPVILLLRMIWLSFRAVGSMTTTLPVHSGDDPSVFNYDNFIAWCLGAALFSHAATSLSVAYFDQSMIYFWMSMALIVSMHQYRQATSSINENLINHDDFDYLREPRSG